MEKTTLLEKVILGLHSSKGQWKAIAKKSGVPYSTITKIAGGITPNPGVLGVQSLADYFSLDDIRILTSTKSEKLHVRGNKPL